MEKITASFIFEEIKKLVEAKIPVQREKWIDIAFRLDVLRWDEVKLLNKMERQVAQKKLDLYKTQEKKNVAAVELEVEASEEYQFAKDQEALIYSLDEMIRIAKRGSDINL